MTTTTPPAGTPAGALTRSHHLLLACVCAVAVSTLYAVQPVITAVGDDLGVSRSALGWLVAAGQLGYLLGLLLLVPLGDVLDRRAFVSTHLLLTAAGVGLTALAPHGLFAGAGLALAGLFAVVVQTAVAYAAATSTPAERGRTLGTVTSGVVVGILGVRVLAGTLGDALGWRSVYVVLAALCTALALLTRLVLPPDPRPARTGRIRRRSQDRAGHPAVLAAAPPVPVTDRLLLSRGLIALFLFASFGTLWSGLALPLGADPWNLSSTAIGLFGLAGLAGTLGAARAGRWADTGRAQVVTGAALALLALSWLLIARTTPTLWLLLAGIVVLDSAVQAVHVSNQHLLTTAHPHRSSRVIGAYMAFYSLGSALGAVGTGWVYTTAGWGACCLLGAGYAVLAFIVWLLARRTAAASPAPLTALPHTAT